MNEQVPLFILFRETSDQYGTSEVVGVYSTRDKAEAVGSKMESRTYAKEITLDKVPHAVEIAEQLRASESNWRKALAGMVMHFGGDMREIEYLRAVIRVPDLHVDEMKAFVYQIVPLGMRVDVERLS